MNTLLDALAGAGLPPHKPPDLVADGRIRRYRVAGDKSGSTNGWLILREQAGRQFATFGSWKTGQQHHWQDRQTTVMTQAERAELQRARAEAARLAQAEQAKVHEAARAKAQRLWDRARPAPDSHPYLTRKRVRGFGLRQLNDMLLVPARDTGGVLHTLQFIGADGSKRFLTGGRIKGCYCPIGRPSGVVLVCEGFSTGASLFEATGHATAACFSAGNLVEVARCLRAKFPALKFVICADDDRGTQGNPGRTAALAAARAVGGAVALPVFEGRPA
jgi:putative DNA primase/helicase